MGFWFLSDPGLTFTYFMTRSNFVPKAFQAFDLKVDRSRQLIELMKICEY